MISNKVALSVYSDEPVQPREPPRGLGDLGRMAIYFQGAGEQW